MAIFFVDVGLEIQTEVFGRRFREQRRWQPDIWAGSRPGNRSADAV